MSDSDFYLAVWPDGAASWQLVSRRPTYLEVELDRLLWLRSKPLGQHGYWLSGECGRSFSVAALARMLADTPSMPVLMEMRDDLVEREGRFDLVGPSRPLPVRW